MWNNLPLLNSNAQVNPAITYGAYEKLKAGALAGYIPLLGATEDGRMSPWGNFILGAMSKTAATIVSQHLSPSLAVC